MLREYGFSQDEVYQPLYKYLATLSKDLKEEFIGDTLDFVTGHIGYPRRYIWGEDRDFERKTNF